VQVITVFEMTCNVSSGTLNLTHSLDHSVRPHYGSCSSVRPSVLCRLITWNRKS